MRICIATTPIRPHPTPFPPFGSMAIIQAIKKIGESAYFYNIDYHRYKHEQIVEYFKGKEFDVVGISAVVSTAYAYTKYLIKLIKDIHPGTIVIVGGNLAASAELLHRKANADYCVIGDGEIICQNLIKAIKNNKTSDNELNKIIGITYLNSKNEFKFTGYDHPLPAPMIETPDFSILEDDKSIKHYIHKHSEIPTFSPDSKLDKEKKTAAVIVAKGCVARCTFCHRFEKGYRVRPLEEIINHMKMLKEKYNVHYINISDENFGSYKDETLRLVKKMKEIGLTWKAAGVRAHTVDFQTLEFWRENGCKLILYGIESGSPTMLKVMEKKITVEQNIKALKATYEAGITTKVQLVIGMPGETDKTINETINFLLETMPYYSKHFRKKIDYIASINYAQSLPGTPLYEYAREKGFIGKDIDSEEKYLLDISDKNASNKDHFINFTQQPLLKVLSWRHKIFWILFREHAKVNLKISLSKLEIFYSFFLMLINKFFKIRLNTPLKKVFDKYDIESASYNIEKSQRLADALRLLMPWNKFTYPFLLIIVAYRESKNYRFFFRLIFEHLKWSFNISKKINLPNITLRKIVNISDTSESLTIRKGR